MKIVVALVLLFTVGIYAQTCNNPMFFENNRVDWWVRLSYLTTPVEYTGLSKVCDGYFDDGDEQCCNDNIYDAITQAWTFARDRIEETVTLARQLKTEFDNARDEWDRTENAIDDSDLSDADKERFKKLINDILDAYSNFIDGVISQWAECASAVLRYWVALVCLGCDPNWSNYIFEIAPGQYRLDLDISLCEDIRGGCRGYFNLYVTLVNDIITAFNEFDDFFAGELIESPCGAVDCEDYICELLVRGIQFNDDSVQGKRDAIKKNSYADLRKKLGEHSKIVDNLVSLHHKIDQMTENHKSLSQRQSTSFSNSITTSGDGLRFDGSKSSLDTDVSGSASVASWLSYVF